MTPPAPLHLTLLGGFEARLASGAVLTLPAKVQALLAYLALRPGQAHPRDKLASLLWGESSDAQARDSLRHAVAALRRAVGPAASILAGEGAALAVDEEAVQVDVALFERLVREETPEALAKATDLYRGDLLEGVSVSEPAFEEWLVAERERLRELAVQALGRFLAHESKTGTSQRAIEAATRLLSLDPLHEVVHRTLMRLYARQGRLAAALKQYQTCAEVLQRELRAEPEAETRQLYQELRERRDAGARGAATPSAVPSPARPRGESGSRRATASDPTPEAAPRPVGPPDGERKHITVLFADLRGCMELVLDRDPEEARAILDPVLERMMAAVRRYGGTVNAVLGDGIMALFGAPRAQEDHAVRACYAALGLQETVTRYAAELHRSHGLDLEVRVGLNSGEVVVRSIEGDLHADYSAVGQATHLAARMEQLAAPGTIRLTADTWRLVEGFIAVKALGPMPVKGMREPVEVFEVAGVGPARTRLQVAATRGLTRFVGREGELGHLCRALEETEQGRGRMVAVIGEPGVGKSRLLHELIQTPRARSWRVLETGGVAHGASMSHLPVITLLKSYAGVEDRDTPREVAERLRSTVLGLDRALEPALPALAALLDAPVDDQEWPLLEPPQRRRRTLDGVKRLLLRASQERPLLLIFEDLHWIDGETQALLDSLVESVPAAPLLLVVTYRPEYSHAWASKSQYAQLRLETLPPPGTGELLEALLGTDASLASLKPMLVVRAGGNPLFVEESVRALVETGALEGEGGAYRLARELPAVRVPATVQAVLAARIDRLPAEEKRLLQTAALIGKEVPFAQLQAVVDLPDEELRAGLARLQDAELLYEASLFPDPEYAFKHALTHEVAYGSVLQDRRRALHARIAEAIEHLHAGRLPEHVERLAHHALRGELREKAVAYLRQAGLKARGRSADHDARGRLEEALSVLEALPKSQSTLELAFEIRLELRPMLVGLGQLRRALDRLREAEALAERLNDDRRRGRVLAVLTNAHSHLGELDEALTTGNRALEIAGRLGDLKLRLLTTTYLEQAHFFRGEYQRVVELATDNLAALPADWAYESLGAAIPTSIYDRYRLIQSLAWLGRFAEAARFEAEALRLAEQTRHVYTVAMVHDAASWFHLLKGDWAEARSLNEHWIAVVRTGNRVLDLPSAVASSAWALAQVGEASEAMIRLREGEAILDHHVAKGYLGIVGWNYCELGRAALLLGRLDEGQSLGERAVTCSPSHPGFAAQARHLLGDIASHSDRFDAERGEAHYREALALAEPRGMRPLVAHCHLGLGTLERRAGKQHAAQEHLATATAMYREMDMRFWLDLAEVEARELA